MSPVAKNADCWPQRTHLKIITSSSDITGCQKFQAIDTDFKAKIGSLLRDYDVRKGNERQIIAVISLFMLRRLIFVILVLFMSKAQPF